MDSKEIYQDSSGRGKKVARIISIAVITIVALMVVSSCFYSINEQTNGVVTQFGKVISVNTAGFYFKAPWQSVRKVDVTTHGTSIGYMIENDTQKGSYPVDEENAIMITSDFNLLNIDFYIEYRVSDPVAYLYNAEDPEGILKNVAMANIRNVVSNYTVDEAMTTGKSQIQSDIKKDIMASLDAQNVGLSLVNITIQDSRPPVESVVSAFKAVETAKQGADTAMNQALQYRNQQIPSAEASADAIVQRASAYKESRIAEAEGQVARFNDMYEEYKKYPLVTKRRMFYEKMEEILPGMKVVITDGDTQTMLPLESFTESAEDGTESPEDVTAATDSESAQ